MKKIIMSIGVAAFAMALFFNTSFSNKTSNNQEFTLSALITNASAQTENQYFIRDDNGNFIEVTSDILRRGQAYAALDQNDYSNDDGGIFDWNIDDYQPEWEACYSNNNYYQNGSIDLSANPGGGSLGASATNAGQVDYNKTNRLACNDGKLESCISVPCV